jgi:hypothetical protein
VVGKREEGERRRDKSAGVAGDLEPSELLKTGRETLERVV